ncbi:hypothetical protein MXB_5482, partial [Myxobolus squamalis]
RTVVPPIEHSTFIVHLLSKKQGLINLLINRKSLLVDRGYMGALNPRINPVIRADTIVEKPEDEVVGYLTTMWICNTKLLKHRRGPFEKTSMGQTYVLQADETMTYPNGPTCYNVNPVYYDGYVIYAIFWYIE